LTKEKQRIAPRVKITKADFPIYKIGARRLRGKLPKMSKAELREMLAKAFHNTAQK